jgi:DNA-directed RNA polymerase subunit RPC12/RpoP
MDAVLIPIILIPLGLCAQFFIASRYDWRCGNCGQTFRLPPLKAMFLPHSLGNSFGGRKLAKCPHCGARTWATAVRKA